ncbi:MAG TPA: nuclear transport factor 2 family protein [Azospirillaceae bacterium]|nr:nuclear transport factor 2 family protein [Azospirillaceae bacterium]
MRRFALPFLAALLLAGAARAESRFGADEAGVRAAVEDYFWGRQNGDRDRLARGMMLEGGDLKGVAEKDGKEVLTQTPMADYAGLNTRPRGLPTEARLQAVDIVDGRMAWVKLRLEAADRDITDYLLLYKIDGAWKIVNKMWTTHPKPREGAPAAR